MPTTRPHTPRHRPTRPRRSHHPRPPGTAQPGPRPPGTALEARPCESAPHPQPPDPIGPLLARLRQERGWSQPHLADRLCAAAGVPTVSRNEVSRWERQSRVPGPFWLGWLAMVLGAPPHLLMAAKAVAIPHQMIVEARAAEPPPELARSTAARPLGADAAQRGCAAEATVGA